MQQETESVPETQVDDAMASGAAAGVAVDPIGSLSPSRAGDFMTCPLLYRFRTIDRLPEPFSPEAVRGTLVHKVLEDLFDHPASERTPATATSLLEPSWEALLAEEPDLAEMFANEGVDLAPWLKECERSLASYFELEDPRYLEPAERELYVETVLDDGLRLRGFVDRLDVAPTGEIRVVDYKTGRAPREAFEGKALFQMKFYALVIWRTRGVIPAMLQLLYLGSGDIVRYTPTEQDLVGTERKLRALWTAISKAAETGDWRPSPSRLCDWCAHQALCPEFGGTPPPLPEPSHNA